MDDPVQMIAVVRGASSAYCRSQEPSEPIIPRSLLLRCHRAVSLSRQKPGIAATTSAGSNLGRETAESLIPTIAIDPRRCGRGDRIGAEGLQQIQGRANSFPTERWRPYIGAFVRRMGWSFGAVGARLGLFTFCGRTYTDVLQPEPGRPSQCATRPRAPRTSG